MNIYNLIAALDELADKLFIEADQVQNVANFLKESADNDNLHERIKELKERAKNWIENE